MMQSEQQQAYWNSVAPEKTFTHPLDLPLLSEWVDKDAHIIDYGCGYGRLVKELSKAGYNKVQGFDTSAGLISRGNAAGLGLTHIAAAQSLPVANSSVDCILLFAVLTCIPFNAEQIALMKLLRRKLMPGGIIYLSDYYLQEDAAETGGYGFSKGSEEAYGVFTLPEGVTFRHHTQEWIQRLTQDFILRHERLVNVRTMNGHAAEAFQMILQKPFTVDIHIETPRLIIRELLPTDEQAMFEMDSDPDVHRYLGNQPYTSIDQSRGNIAFIRQQYLDNGIGRWAAVLKDTGEFIGWTGFKLMREMVNGHVNHYDFGYRHMRKFWGQGYAYEAAKAALDYGIDVLGLTDIYGMTDVDNKGSRRLLEKLGFSFIEIFSYDAPPTWRSYYGEPATWYELTPDYKEPFSKPFRP